MPVPVPLPSVRLALPLFPVLPELTRIPVLGSVGATFALRGRKLPVMDCCTLAASSPAVAAVALYCCA